MTKTVSDLYLNVLEMKLGRVSEAVKELYLAFCYDFADIADDFFALFYKYGGLELEEFEEKLYLHAMLKSN